MLDYDVQSTPFVLRDLGWDLIKELAATTRPGFQNEDFRHLVFSESGATGLDGRDENVKCIFAPVGDKALMIVPYLDSKGVKVLYFKWADETLYDSFSVPDGQNRVWDNREKK